MYLLLTVAIQLSACWAALSYKGDPLVIETNVGSFRGQLLGDAVRSWKGIPFAKPTNGTSRFMAPTRADIIPRGRIFNATQFGLSCPEIISSATRRYGEDCLSLNIWAPLANSSKSNEGANVMVFIYGGAFLLGSSADPDLDAYNWVHKQNDTIVVTFNYRTNLFGFPTIGSGLNRSDVNPGLLDQRMAIEWVYNNIRNFGGDPSKITLAGQSAGGASAAMWSYTYKSDPIVRGLILQSGSEYLLPFITATNDTAATENWNQVASQAGCNGTIYPGKEAQLKCMQHINFTTLYTALQSVTVERALSGPGLPNFLPTPNGLNVFTQDQYLEMSQRGDFAKLPIYIGSTENEATVFGIYTTSPPEVVTRNLFTCPVGQVAVDRRNAFVPTWQYRYQGQWPNINLPGTHLGSFHSSDIPMVFRTYNMSTATVQQNRTSDLMQKAYTVFTADPQCGLKTQLGWDTTHSRSADLVIIGQHNNSSPVFSSIKDYTFGCQDFPRYFQLNVSATDIAKPV